MNRAENNIIRKTYISKLADLRRYNKGLSLRNIASLTGITPQTLHNWENGTNKNIGHRYKEEAKELAKLYDISVDKLNELVHDAWLTFKKQTDKYKSTLNTKNELFKLRLENYRTLKEVANYLGTSISTVLQYEKGTKFPDSESLKKLSAYYGVNVEDLNKSLTER